VEKTKLTIICPVFNEESTVPLFFHRVQRVRQELAPEYNVDILFCNNASTDGTLVAIEELRKNHAEVFVITLSRNVGYQRSIECGLRNAKGDLFVIIDVDCEDPPEMIVTFAAKYREGYDVVYGERIDREEAAWIKSLRKAFYRVLRLAADQTIILDMAEFSLMTAEVRDAIVRDQTSFPFIRASIGRVGFRIIGIPYKRAARIAGETHYNLVGMTIFAIAGILSSSTLLLRLPIYALPFWTVAVAGLAVAIAWSPKPWMYPSLLALIALYLGATAAFLAIYVARIYHNTLGRPNFIIRRSGTHLQP
jgi:glycosyltransferase involved in cell wall biosynthesis